MAERGLDQPAESALSAWLDYLSGERRYSPKTIEHYDRDVSAFLEFQAGHLGRALAADDLSRLKATDFRAWLASRRRDGVSARSLARYLSSVRSFYKYLERRWGVDGSALGLVETPKIPRSLPKPVSADAARQMIAETGAREKPDWVAARDAAVLLLLYGCGLRISEALAIKGSDLPLTDVLRVTGKGNKTRLCPPCATRWRAMAISARSILNPTNPFSAPCAAARLARAPSRRWRPSSVRVSACPPVPPRTRCGTALPPTSWPGAGISAPSRSCSAMPACRQRRSMPPWKASI